MSAAHTTPVHHLRDEQLHAEAEALQQRLNDQGRHRDAFVVIELSIRLMRVSPVAAQTVPLEDYARATAYGAQGSHA